MLESWITQHQVDIAASGCTICTCMAISAASDRIHRLVFPEYKLLPQSTKVELQGRAVGIAHALVVGLGGLHLYANLEGELTADTFYMTTPTSRALNSIALGYFVWDIFESFRHNWGSEFIMHALACAGTYAICMRPFQQLIGVVYLMFELSTPFLHGRRYCIDVLGNKDTAFFQFCNVMFIGVFFLVRICFGLTFSVHWAREQWGFLHTEPAPSAVDQFCCWYLYIANFTLCSLNIHWFSVIVRNVWARLKNHED